MEVRWKVSPTCCSCLASQFIDHANLLIPLDLCGACLNTSAEQEQCGGFYFLKMAALWDVLVKEVKEEEQNKRNW